MTSLFSQPIRNFETDWPPKDLDETISERDLQRLRVRKNNNNKKRYIIERNDMLSHAGNLVKISKFCCLKCSVFMRPYNYDMCI